MDKIWIGRQFNLSYPPTIYLRQKFLYLDKVINSYIAVIVY